jgi:hypothetical protein
MKALKIVGLVFCGFVLLAVLLVGVAFVPAVQTWAVRKAVTGQPGRKLEIGRVAAGLSATEIRDVRLVQDGLVVTVKRVFARYSTWDYFFHKRVNLDRIEVQGLVVNTRQMPVTATTALSAPVPAEPMPARGTRPPVFVGILRLAQLPLDVRFASLVVEGRALLPGDRAIDFTLQGGGVEIGRRGQLTWKIDFSDPTTAASLRALHANGAIGFHIAADRRIDLIEIENSATAEGPRMPPDGLRLELKAEQASPEANEVYTTRVSLVRNAKAEPIFDSRVNYVAGGRKLEGTWNLAVRSDQLAALLAGFGLPTASAQGEGKFTFQPDTAMVLGRGELNVSVAGLEKLGAQFPAVGPLLLHLMYDGAFADNLVRLNQLEVELRTEAGQKLLSVGTAQAVVFDVATQRFVLAQPGAELARVSIQRFPLVWAQAMAKGLTIDRGELSATFSIVAESDGSQVHLRSIQPVTFGGVTLRDGERKLVDDLSLTLSPAIDYSAGKVTAEVPDLNLSLPAGDEAKGTFKAEVTGLAKTPVVAFAAQFQERLVSVIQPFLSFDPGPITVESAIDGRLQGQSLQLTKFASSVKFRNGAPVASFETLQPLTADFATVRISAANAAAAVARIRLGELPLSLAQSWVPRSKLAGALNSAILEISLPGVDQVVVHTAAPVSLRGIGVAMNDRWLVKGLDLDLDFSAAKHGETLSAEAHRIEVKQGATLLARLDAAGETTLGGRLNASGKGKLEVDLAAVMKQPALASSTVLSRGNLTADFEVTSGDSLQVKAKVAVRNLVSLLGGQSLGDVDCPLTATLKTDGSGGTVKIPLTLALGDRRSDLTFDGSFSRTASMWSLDGKIGSNQIVVDDLKALAVLAPQGPASSAPAGPKPAGGNETAPSAPAGSAEKPKSAAAPGAVTPTAFATPARDTRPFWNGFGGRIDASLKQVKYGRNYAVSDVRCAAAITETRLTLDHLDGKFQADAFKAAAAITFAAKDPQPYTLTGAIDIPGFDVGAFLRAANPHEAPALETKATLNARLHGRGTTASDLAQNAYGQIDVAGSKGILRALGKKGDFAGAASTVLGLFGAITGSGTSVAAGQFAAELKEMPFDRFTMRVDRGADLNLSLTSLEFVSSATRLTGSGTIKNQKGVSIADQPLHVELQLAGREHMAVLLGDLNLLNGQKDDKGYSRMSSSFVLGGTPANPDSSQLWKIVGSAAASLAVPAAAKALEGLLH